MTVLGSIEFSLTMCPREFWLCGPGLFLPEEVKCCWFPPPTYIFPVAFPDLPMHSLLELVDRILLENVDCWRPLLTRVETPEEESFIPMSFLITIDPCVLSSSGIVGGCGGRSASSSPTRFKKYSSGYWTSKLYKYNYIYIFFHSD